MKILNDHPASHLTLFSRDSLCTLLAQSAFG